jgi:hypothetical protein
LKPKGRISGSRSKFEPTRETVMGFGVVMVLEGGLMMAGSSGTLRVESETYKTGGERAATIQSGYCS